MKGAVGMLQINRIYRLFPKPRFYLISGIVVAALLGDEIYIKAEAGGFRVIGTALLVMMVYMIVVNGSAVLSLVLIRGSEGAKYFRSLPNAYRNFYRAVLLNEFLSILLTAAICLFVWFAGLGERKVYLLLIVGEIVLNAAHLSMRAKTRMQHISVFGGAGGLIGLGGSIFSTAEVEIALPVLQIIAAIVGAGWIIGAVFLFKDLPRLWTRD